MWRPRRRPWESPDEVEMRDTIDAKKKHVETKHRMPSGQEIPSPMWGGAKKDGWYDNQSLKIKTVKFNRRDFTLKKKKSTARRKKKMIASLVGVLNTWGKTVKLPPAQKRRWTKDDNMGKESSE